MRLKKNTVFYSPGGYAILMVKQYKTSKNCKIQNRRSDIMRPLTPFFTRVRMLVRSS